jgi:hypothetical protein
MLMLFVTVSGTGMGTIQVPFMDIQVAQSASMPYQLCTKLEDKRRHPKYGDIKIIQYCHNSSFLTRSCKINILTSQYHRFKTLITKEACFHLEVAITIYKMIHWSGYDKTKLLKKLRTLVDVKRYTYSHHAPLHHYNRITRWLEIAENSRGLGILYKAINTA